MKNLEAGAINERDWRAELFASMPTDELFMLMQLLTGRMQGEQEYRWMAATLFSAGSVELDNDNQIVIYTGAFVEDESASDEPKDDESVHASAGEPYMDKK